MDINQKFFKYLVYYPVVYLRGQDVPGKLKLLERFQYVPKEELEALQREKLQQLVLFAKNNVPAYQKRLGHIKQADIKARDLLSRLPTISKQEIKTGDFVSRVRYLGITRKTTGGSTGEPVTIHKTRGAMAWELAVTWRGYRWAGVDIGDRQARFWGVSLTRKSRLIARLTDLVTNRRRCSAFSFGPEDMAIYTKKLLKFKPTYFYGYVSMLEEYARYFKERGEKTPFKLKCIITTSEVLTEYHRSILEEVFCAKVFNEYGSGELGSVAHECEHGSMHLSAENMIVEILKGNRPCRPGEIGELVITELNNYAMPLIRYRTGDFASFSPQECRCGRSLPVIKNLYGRAYDIIRNSQGKLFHGEIMMYIFEEAQRRDLGINAFQVIQEARDTLRIKIVPGIDYGKRTTQFITNRIKEKFDPEAKIVFEIVDKIERCASGKMRLIIGLGM